MITQYSATCKVQNMVVRTLLHSQYMQSMGILDDTSVLHDIDFQLGIGCTDRDGLTARFCCEKGVSVVYLKHVNRRK